MKLECCSDANWGGEEGRESVSEFVFAMTGGAVTYSLKKQGSVALSTTESEYVASLHALKEQIWLLRLLKNRPRHQQPKHHLHRQPKCYRTRSQSGKPCSKQAYRHSVSFRQELRRRWKDPFGVLSNGGYGGRWIDKIFGTGEAQEAGKDDGDGHMEGS